MHRLLFFLFVSLIFSFSVRAQTSLSGKVFDTDGNPLVGATVQISSLNKGAVTDDDGSYKIENLPKQELTVKATSVGFKEKSETVKLSQKSKTLDFRLTPESVKHSEIVVTGKSEAQVVRELPQAITVIDTKEIEGRVVTVSSLLNRAVGIKIRQAGGEGSATRVSVRGLEGKRIGFFIDGFPMSENSDFVDVDDIPVSLIKRIEVYKGVVPAKFGGSSIGGAVNLVLKEYPPTYIEASYSRESFNTNKATLILKKNNPESGYEMGVGGFYTYADNTYKMEIPGQYGSIIDYPVTRDHDVFEKLVLGGSFSSTVWGLDEVEFEPVYIRQAQDIQGIGQNIRKAETFLDAFALVNNIEDANFLYKDLEMQLTQAYGYSNTRFIDTASVITQWDGATSPAPTDFGGEIGNDANDSDNKRHTYMNRLNLNYPFNENHGVNLNSVFRFADFRPKDALKDSSLGYKTNFDSRSNSLVLGLTHEYKSGGDVFINALSLKYYTYSVNTTLISLLGENRPEEIDFTKSDFGINNALRFRLTPTFLLKASYAYDLRLPSEDELLGDGYTISAAGNLKPERNNSLNLGAMFDASFSRDTRLQVEFNVFYYDIKDMIRLTPGINQFSYQNFGEIRGIGADFEIKYDMNENIFMYANATYQDLRDTREFTPGTSIPNPTKDDRMPNIPYFYANAGFEFRKQNLFGGTGQNSRLYLDGSFVEEFFYDFEQTELKKRSIPQSLSFDVGFEHSMYNDGFIITAQINNLTDETLISEYNRPLPGRSFGLRFRYIFK